MLKLVCEYKERFHAGYVYNANSTVEENSIHERIRSNQVYLTVHTSRWTDGKWFYILSPEHDFEQRSMTQKTMDVMEDRRSLVYFTFTLVYYRWNNIDDINIQYDKGAAQYHERT